MTTPIPTVGSGINWHITSGTVRCRVLSATSLAPKDNTGYSDPYVKVGMAGDDGKLLDRPQYKKSEIIHQTLNPVWKEALFMTKLPVPLSDRIKIEVWDDDHIGKDDFDGECYIDLGLIPENQTVQWDAHAKHPKMTTPIPTVGSGINWHITSGTVRCRVLSATSLAPKDNTGYSDPYVKVGMAGDDGKLLDRPQYKKSEIIHQTLNPVWKEALFMTKLPVPLSDRIKIEVWDDDHIGKDDFDGECYIDLGLIPENQTVQWDVQLRPRPHKKKEKIDGHVTVELYIISDKLREQLGSHELKATSAQRLSLDTRRKDEESK
eukprot:TRINITY_DN7386_c0_g1_i1.p1 TRINITY_DN7386_c0_g1~~TRINITY_DN7386_c0_g1_i1.p1  ORF type:complete len:334 (-),score=56.11 TRINITY_DN7386_c0_g1_i1:132-1091(-)